MTIPNDEPYYNDDGQTPEQPQDQPDNFPEDGSENSQPASEENVSSWSPAEELGHDFDFPRMDDDVAAFRRELDELKVPSPENIPEDEPVPQVIPAPRRRRRTARITERLSASDLGDRLESIIQRASPSVDFYVFSFLCGCILSVGYILDAPAILMIGIFIAPLLGPLVGASLSAVTGETRLFRQTFGGTISALLMVFIIGILAGFASRIFQPLTFSQAFFHARLWWPDLLLLVIGTAVLIISFIQSDDNPIVPSLMVAYELFLPASAAGFGLGSGIQGLWPQAGLVFLIHLALTILISLVIFFYMGFHPLHTSGYVLTAVLILAGLVIMGGFAGFGSLINIRGDQAYATSIAAQAPTHATATVAATNIIPTPEPSPVASTTASRTPPPPTSTLAAITTTLAAITPTINVSPAATLLPTPVYGRVESPSGGLMVREKPAGKSITTVQNGYLAQILGDIPIIIDGATWVHVIITTPSRDIDGWVLLSLIVTATPSFSP